MGVGGDGGVVIVSRSAVGDRQHINGSVMDRIHFLHFIQYQIPNTINFRGVL